MQLTAGMQTDRRTAATESNAPPLPHANPSPTLPLDPGRLPIAAPLPPAARPWAPGAGLKSLEASGKHRPCSLTLNTGSFEHFHRRHLEPGATLRSKRYLSTLRLNKPPQIHTSGQGMGKNASRRVYLPFSWDIQAELLGHSEAGINRRKASYQPNIFLLD